MFGPEYFRDPHPLFSRLRALRPVTFSRELGRWIVTGYADAVSVLRDVTCFSSGVVPRLPPGADGPALGRFRRLSSRWLFFLDPPRHGRERAPLARGLAPAVVRADEDAIRRDAEELLEPHRAAGGMDVVADYAHPLAARTIARLVGGAPEDGARLRAACRGMEAAGVDAHHRPTWERGLASIAEATALVEARVAQAAGGGPTTPLLAELLEAERAGVLDRDAVCAHLLVLLFAGVETTQNLIANAVDTLLRDPARLTPLRDRPRAEAAVEECLRFEPPVLGVLRRARQPVVLGGQELGAGDEVVVMVAAANRDAARFADPQRFDAARTDDAHLAFGLGPHYCPGAALARLTARVALETLLSRGQRITAAALPEWRDHDPIVRGPKTLPVTFAPR